MANIIMAVTPHIISWYFVIAIVDMKFDITWINPPAKTWPYEEILATMFILSAICSIVNFVRERVK